MAVATKVLYGRAQPAVAVGKADGGSPVARATVAVSMTHP